MAVTIDTTLSGEQSNSYVDVAFADSYWQDHFNTVRASTWAALTAGQKARALVQACRLIETIRFTEDSPPRFQFRVFNRHRDRTAVRASYSQALQFPRNLDILSNGTFFIPVDVMEAQCEQAVYLPTFDETVVTNRAQGIIADSVSVGDVEVSQRFADGATASTTAMPSLAPMAIELLRKYMRSASHRLKRA